MGTVEAAWAARDRLQEVGSPDRLADLDGLSRVERSLELAPLEYPQLEPGTVLRAFLSLTRRRVDEVQVADQHADTLESEGVEHGRSLSWADVGISRLVLLSPAPEAGG